jgi:hypothetical protein
LGYIDNEKGMGRYGLPKYLRFQLSIFGKARMEVINQPQ